MTFEEWEDSYCPDTPRCAIRAAWQASRHFALLEAAEAVKSYGIHASKVGIANFTTLEKQLRAKAEGVNNG